MADTSTATVSAEGQNTAHGGSHAVEPSTLYVFAFIFFLLLIGRALYRMIMGQLRGYRDAVITELADAARLRQEAEALQQEYVTRMASAEADVAEIISRARAEADSFKAQAFADLQKEIEERKRAALEKNALFESLIQHEFRDSIVNATVASIEQALQHRNETATSAALNGSVMAVIEKVASDPALKKAAA